MSSSNGTCYKYGIISTLGFDFDYAFMSDTHVNNSAMVSCCYPNPVALAQRCYIWCEVDRAVYPEITNFTSCLNRYDDDWGAAALIIQDNASATAARSPSLKVLGTVALLAAGLASFA